MTASVIPLFPSRPPVPGPEVAIAELAAALGRAHDEINERAIETAAAWAETDAMRARAAEASRERDARLTGGEVRSLCIGALAFGVILGSAIASFAAPIPPAAETCSILVAEADAHAARVVPAWPMGLGGEPTTEQQDAIFAADGEGDPDAAEALLIYGRAMDAGCW